MSNPFDAFQVEFKKKYYTHILLIFKSKLPKCLILYLITFIRKIFILESEKIKYMPFTIYDDFESYYYNSFCNNDFKKFLIVDYKEKTAYFTDYSCSSYLQSITKSSSFLHSFSHSFSQSENEKNEKNEKNKENEKNEKNENDHIGAYLFPSVFLPTTLFSHPFSHSFSQSENEKNEENKENKVVRKGLFSEKYMLTIVKFYLKFMDIKKKCLIIPMFCNSKERNDENEEFIIKCLLTQTHLRVQH
jgi:hypothetical protein